MSAPVKKNPNKIKHQQQQFLLKCCLQTWSRYIMIFGGSFLSLPEGISNHIMNPYFEEDKKVTKSVTLTLTQKCFSTSLPPVWSGKPQVFSYTPPPFHWSDTDIVLEPAWSTGAVLKFWKHEQWSHRSGERSAAFPA